MEEIDYSMLFRWFIGLNLDEEVWDATIFTKNRYRLLEAGRVERVPGPGLRASPSPEADLGWRAELLAAGKVELQRESLGRKVENCNGLIVGAEVLVANGTGA